MRCITRRKAVKSLAVVGVFACTGNVQDGSGIVQRETSKPNEPVRIGFSANGEFLAVASSKNLKVYDGEGVRLIHDLVAHQRALHCLAYSNDRRLLASDDGESKENRLLSTVRLWDLKSGKQLRAMDWSDSDVSSVRCEATVLIHSEKLKSKERGPPNP